MQLFCKLSFLFISVFAFAQKTNQFSVEMIKSYDSNTGKEIFTGNNIYTDENLIPVYHYEESIVKGRVKEGYSMNILDRERVSASDLTQYNLGEIPKSPDLKIIISKEKGKSLLNFEFYPIYNDVDGYYKILNVEVNYELDNTSLNKFSSVYTTNTTSNSILSTGNWYKIGVDRTGVYKIDATFLENLGIDISDIVPDEIRLYGSGGAILSEEIDEGNKNGLVENAISVIGGEDGVFNSNDYILFYAQGPVSWELNSRRLITHQQNYYSDYGYYFINIDSGVSGKRVALKSEVNESATIEVNTFTDYSVHEKELTNYVGTGKQWFGEDFSVNDSQNFDFDFSDIISTENTIIDVNYSAKSTISTSYSLSYDSQLQTTSIGTVSSGSKNGYSQRSQRIEFLTDNENGNINIVYNNNGDVSAQAHLDYIRVVVDKKLNANGNQFDFVNFDSATNNEVLNYTLTNSSNIDFVWDITDLNNPVQLSNQSSENNIFSFKEITDNTLNKYQVIEMSDTYAPINLGEDSIVENQNLQALQDIHYIIVTNKELLSEANVLAEYHRNNTKISDTNLNNINVEVVEVDKIYNEFGSGTPDISAIRNFIKYVYDNASSDENQVKYVCLFGDATYDYKGITHNNSVNVFAFSSLNSLNLEASYNSDDFYGYMDDVNLINSSGGINLSPKLDVATGRIPVKDSSEAKIVVDKILNYYSSNSYGSWKNIVTLLGDDGQEGESQDLIEILEGRLLSETEAEGFAANIGLLNSNFNITKLYADAFIETVTTGGGSYPEVKSRFLDAFDNGSLVINYFGHGNSSAIGEENYLDISDIRAINNTNNLPLFITVTCDFSRFDNHNIVSAGEEMVLLESGGVSSMITTTRQIFISAGEIIGNQLAKNLFLNNDSRTIAEVLKDAKNSSFTSNKYFVYFFGDPAMPLSVPTTGIKIDKIQKYTTDEVTKEESLEDTTLTVLEGLSKIRVTGGVYDNDVLDSDFNGDLEIVLYGEEIERSTLLNEEGGVTSNNIENVVTYGSLENKFFKGTAAVTNGTFSFDFVLPKDVSVLPEDSKFSLYAASTNEERTGSDFSYQVGGVDPDVEEDVVPPVLSVFIDNTTFGDGGSTADSTPRLIVEIEDDSGINTSLSSVGHDISLIIDGDASNPVSLNDFYTTEKGDFTKGVVDYELEELEPGNHTVSIKAWDTHNNSGTQTLNFVVEENTGFKIDNVLNYPNPFIDYTEFWFQNNKVNSPLEIKVQIYTVSGKLIKTVLGEDLNENNDLTGVVRSVIWDGKDDYGNRLAKGVYLYRIKVKDISSGDTDEKIEKLVIL